MKENLDVFQNFLNNSTSQIILMCQPSSGDSTAVQTPVASFSPV